MPARYSSISTPDRRNTTDCAERNRLSVKGWPAALMRFEASSGKVEALRPWKVDAWLCVTPQKPMYDLFTRPPPRTTTSEVVVVTEAESTTVAAPPPVDAVIEFTVTPAPEVRLVVRVES